MSKVSQRKGDHLDLCATDAVSFKGKTTLFECVQLIHNALPELAVSEIDCTTQWFGKTTTAPLVIAAMTGGLARAEEVNRDLASVAEEAGIAFGFGSMRPLLEDGVKAGYFVRDIAPTALLFGNIGIVQAKKASTEQLIDMVQETGLDALCVHLNPAMEVIQAHGDRDFRGGLDTLTRLIQALPVPIIVKETGCGLSETLGQTVAALGIEWVDVSGAGGTSWVGVETLRAKVQSQRLGEMYWDWGIPTAASVCQLAGSGLNCIATGGIATGLDLAKAIATGATAGGIARPFLQAWNQSGREGVLEAVTQIADELRFACLLTGAKRPTDLRDKPLVIHQPLRDWIPAASPLWSRLGRPTR